LFHFCARTGKLIQRSKPAIVEKEIIPVTDPDLQSLSYQPMIETFLKDPYAFINTNPVLSAFKKKHFNIFLRKMKRI